MLTLFELLNLPIGCDFEGVPVLLSEDSEGCRVWEGQTPNTTCETLKACIDMTFLNSLIPTPSSSIVWNPTASVFEMSIDQTWLDTNINSTWLAPIFTIGNQQYNLSPLLLDTSIFRSISDPYQQHAGQSPLVIGNKKTLMVAGLDSMILDVTNLGFDLTVGLPHEFITTPLGAPSEYNYNYWTADGMTEYNPRRYVLTWYSTTTVNGVDRNCGRAVWAEPQCCMQSLSLDGCMLSLEGGDCCEGRCQTIASNVNGSLSQGICTVFSQTLTYQPNEICYQLPGATQADPYIDVCIDISETNNHYLLTYSGSEVDNYLLELYNHNGELQTAVDLGFMFDQTLVYNTVPETNIPHPAPATINNTICITQPLGTPDQCVDLNRVNNQGIILKDDCTLVINSILDPQNDCDLNCNGRVLDIKEYLDQWKCSIPCDCMMGSVPDWSTLIAEPPTGWPSGWAAFIASNPSVEAMMNWLVDHIAFVQNEIGPHKYTSTGYTSPCSRAGGMDSDVPTCDDCCDGVSNSGITINGWTINEGDNIWIVLNDKKHHGKRWLTTDRTVTQSFNGSIDPDTDVCNPLNNNQGWYPAGNAFAGAYGRDPLLMLNSQMTLPFNAISGIKCLVDGSYDVYLDGPIEINHMVHSYRIAMMLNRDGNDIILLDYRVSGDPQSGSGSVNNGYFKETKQIYVHANKHIELIRGDIVTLQVKIDTNCSRPWDNLDPITLGDPLVDTSLRSDAPNVNCVANEDGLIYQCIESPNWTVPAGWGISNTGVWIEYGGPATLEFSQNFNNLRTTSPAIYHWLNGFIRTDERILSTPTLTHSGCFSVDCSDHPPTALLSHSHSVVARFPAIPPQAPKYIHFTDENNADWNYPGRYTDATLNSANNATAPYSNTGIDAEGRIVFLARNGLDESVCPADSHYNFIAEQTGFSFGFNMIRGLREDQIEIYP